jgi:hypothetical protein
MTQISQSSRRDFFSFAAKGIGAVALTDLLLRDQSGNGTAKADRVPSAAADPWPHHKPKATRVIHIVLTGGLSQVDSFDYKPELEKQHGKSLNSKKRPDVFFNQVGLLRKPDWKFKQRGKSGLWVSELFPHLAKVADELTVIKSMYAETSNHTPATFQESTGFRLNGFPTVGSWLSFGMGAETDELPAYVVIPDPRGLPAGGSINWSNGFLAARHQGVTMRSKGAAIDDLFPAEEISPATEQASQKLLAAFNQQHLKARGKNDDLSARIRSYELAAKIQMAVPEVVSFEKETQATQTSYGVTAEKTADFGRGCLLARRLLEKGVRYVQLFAGGAFGSPRINWDGHEDMVRNHGREAVRIDQPIAALLTDLRQRGLLNDTLVLFTSEFGRTPFTQSKANQVGKGRDHNQNGFSVWMAGAGLKSGFAYGETDEVGWNATVDRVHWHDFHATVLHLLGINHKRLTFYHNGIEGRLTNVHGHVVAGVLA